MLDVAQFFPSVNHRLLNKLLKKQGFAPEICEYFQDYLKNRQTQFLFNGDKLAPMDFSVGVGQGSSLSPILTGLYIAPAIYKIAPVHKTLDIEIEGEIVKLCQPWTPKEIKANGHITVQFFVDDGLIHVGGKLSGHLEEKQYEQLLYNNIILKKVFKSLVSNLTKLELAVETDKLELMHFVQRKRDKEKAQWSDDKLLGPTLKVKDGDQMYTIQPKSSMRYLGFMLDPKLMFKEHIKKFAIKGISTLAAIKMLGNLSRGLSPKDKRRLYIANIVPVLTYGAQLW